MEKMHDLVVLLPGITGSVLQKDGEDLWAVSGEALWTLMRDHRDRIATLRLASHDPAKPAPDDGVRATRLIYDFHGVFGLWKIDGYDTMARLVTDNFEVARGHIEDPKENQNFFEFPYDWRRSNRESAAALERFVGPQLVRWRRWSHWNKARVILLAHSMGGLVARYYLEALGHWADCRALITFGTPYRGSFDALRYLANGFNKAGIDISDVIRSMPSVYELMPRYPAVKVGNAWQRVAETQGLPETIDFSHARAALAFHDEIDTKVDEHRQDPNYLKSGYSITPVVGLAQKTLQSATLRSNILEVTDEYPKDVVDEAVRGGDGRVPRISATPIELGNHPPAVYFVEQHSSLQNNSYVLDDLRARLQQLQVDPERPPVRGTLALPRARAAIGIDVEELFMAGEPVVIRANLQGLGAPSGGLTAEIKRSGKVGRKFSRPLAENSDGFKLDLGELTPGQYRVTVRSSKKGASAALPVHDVFEVAGKI